MKYAITGGIGSGKSYVCSLLKKYGISVYDCDQAAKRLMATERKLQERISETVGKDVFPNGVLNKATLAEFLLASKENNEKINHIVHPAVAADFHRSGLDWMESAILYEAHFEENVDRVVCVTAPLETRISRVIERDGITRSKAEEWINRQMSQEEKVSRSHYIICNDGETPLIPQIEDLLLSIRTKNFQQEQNNI